MSEFDRLDGNMAADFVATFFRLFRLAKMHDLDNDASRRALERGVEQLESYLDGQVRYLSMLIAGETIYVNGQPLKVDRQAYDNALATCAILSSMGFNELTIKVGITTGDLYGLLKSIALDQVPAALPDTIRLREVDPKSVIGEDEEQASIGEQVVATYSAAVVLCRRFHEQVARDDFTLLRHIKRVSQRMVTLSSGGLLEWLALVRRPLPPTDEARRAVHAAIIGVLAGRALTRDMHALLRISMACLKGDIGRPRVVGMYREDAFQGAIVPAPNEAMRRRLPASTAAILLQTGRASMPALKRTIVAYEAIHLSDGALLGWPYVGRMTPTVEGIIAAQAMRVGKELAQAAGPDELVNQMRSDELGKVERATVELCLSILGIMPQGTVVQMESGDVGVVSSAGASLHDVEHPRVTLVQDEFGRTRTPLEIWSGGEHGWIRRVIHEPTSSVVRAYENYRSQSGGVDVSVTSLPSADDSIDRQSTLVFNPDEVTVGPDAPEFLRAIWEE